MLPKIPVGEHSFEEASSKHDIIVTLSTAVPSVDVQDSPASGEE